MSEGTNASDDTRNNKIISALMQEWLETRLRPDSPLLAPAVAAMQHLGQAAESLFGKSLAAILLDPSSDRAALEILQKHFEHVCASVESENELSVAVALSLAAGASVFVYHSQTPGSDSGENMIESFAELAAQDWVPSACKGLFWQAHQKCLQEKGSPLPLKKHPNGHPDSISSQSGTKSISSPESLVEKLGNRIGPYKLLRKLGEGGMGVVYLARQEHPLKRQVALKIIKPGMDSKQIIARFEAERQALALLDHPNIAHVYDAGTTHNSRPYFVMEYVNGVPITEHCDRHRLTIDERLDLFLKVCAAVQHAHQKGIIHRDIKPSNIQVSIQGEQFVPKVIDFGVAKATSQLLTERTLITEQGQFVGTPEYMSPEQAEMATQDIDTRSDIYSLGIVLYEFLTGALPFDSDVLREGGIDHIRKVIREENPKTPSTRVSTIVGEESSKVAQLRRTDLRSLGRTLRGDLDWITIKAMEKDRTRRYQSVQALMEDIQRYLNNEPVLAGPPSKIYHLKKLVQKHRTQAIAAVLMTILIAAVAIISTMYVRASSRGKNAESLEHKGILSKAQKLRSNGQFQEALSEVETILPSGHIGPEARLLYAKIVLKLQGPVETINLLEELTQERDEIAWNAHFLLARIYLETDPDNPEDVLEYQRLGKYHQQEGKRLRPESPEAYFNQSMMAGTVNRTLEYLDKAIDLDRGHYDSREARALAYYALKEYGKMETDASIMIGRDSDNSMGYSLRAIARRETAIQQDEEELFAEALKDHNKAIGLSDSEPELYDQRRHTYMQMGKYEKALSDARACVSLQPDEKIYPFHAFCALVALGRYDDAETQYRGIIESDLMKEWELEESLTRYISDTLDAGLSWSPADHRPEGSAFLAMNEAADIYEQLKDKKARRIVSQGFHTTWSHDGTEIAYSRGILGFSGIEVLNLEKEETRLLTVPGFDPAWSPDGGHIAYTRTRKRLLLADLTAEHTAKEPYHKEREIWIIDANGTGNPEFLAKGYWPGWSRDSKRVYFHLPEDMKLYSISLEDGAIPIPIILCPNYYPVVSPDEKYIARRGIERQIVRISDNSIVAHWSVPLAKEKGFLNWSPNGKELSIGDTGNSGLWIYNVEKKEASKVLSGSFSWCSWSPDAGQIAIEKLRGDIWVADTAALRPGRTIEEHCQEMKDYYRRRIEIDPENAYNYLSLARFYIDLGDKEMAFADLKKYADIVKDVSKTAAAYDRLGTDLVFRPKQTVNPEIVVELCRKAHEMEPENGDYLVGLAAAHYRAGQWQEAIATTANLTELLDEKNCIRCFFMAMAHWQSGDKVKATNWHNRAIEWVPENDLNWRLQKTYYSLHLEASQLMGIKMK